MFSASYFVDPTIPGLSLRDLQEKAAERIVTHGNATISHADLAIRRGLSHLDREALRDLGLDRAAA